MTGDQLYDRTKEILRDQRTPGGCYWTTKLTIHLFLMEEVPQPKVYQWKKTAKNPPPVRTEPEP